MSKIKLSKEFIRSTVKLALNEDLYPSGDITSSLIENIYDLESSMLYSENISRLGHVQSCDPLINLADYCASTTQKCGEYILLLCSGLYSWGATVLRRT